MDDNDGDVNDGEVPKKINHCTKMPLWSSWYTCWSKKNWWNPPIFIIFAIRKAEVFSSWGKLFRGPDCFDPLIGGPGKIDGIFQFLSFFPLAKQKHLRPVGAEIFRGQIFYHPSREADFFRDNFFKKCQKSPFFFILGGFRAFYFSSWKFIKRRGQVFFSTLR